jgi:microcystin degradation protein MlrC
VTGQALLEQEGGSYSEVTGFLDGLGEEGLEAVQILSARATPSGTIGSSTLERLVSELFDALKLSKPLDGILVAPHGAAVSEDIDDVDGYWLRLLRKRIGPDVPLVCTLDLHANVSAAMVDSGDATIAYRTNPHLDTFERGCEAAALMARLLRGRTTLTQSATSPPVAVSILSQDTGPRPVETSST